MAANEFQSAPTRRGFLADSLLAGGGLVVALSFGRRARAAVVSPEGELPADFAPNAFVRIAPDGQVTVVAKHDEMGQGIHTGLAIAVCEELEVPVASVRVVPAPADARYANSAYHVQVTGGSTSTWSSLDQMRTAGATARLMLVAAAATRWGVPSAVCEARNATVRTRDGSRVLPYRELLDDAAKMPVPEEIPLKERADFTQIGKPTPRLDSPDKVRGKALFSLDRRVPGMLTALVARAPSFGGTVAGHDDRAARKIPGVKAIVRVPSGVAVVADGYWSAYKAREALEIEWKAGPGAAVDTKLLRREYRALAEKPGLVSHAKGNADAALDRASRCLEATYEVPFQAHAPMEPLSCLVTLKKDGGADIVTGTQMMGADHPKVASRLGVPPEKVNIENSFLGGGFGRRANPQSDFIIEAVEVALAARQLGAPIKTVWTREDDLRGGWYRPMFVNRLSAGIEEGKIVAWRHRVVGQSIAKGTAFAAVMIKDGIDNASVEGADDLPYAIPNVSIQLHTTELPVPVQWWRSVGHSNTAFAKEGMLDECAVALGRDAYELRRELLEDHPRQRRVLDLAAEKAGWSEKLPKGVGRGISVHESFKGFAAHVIEASVENGRPRVRRIVCAIDCGLVVNPDQVASQMQGAAIFALSATLGSGITFADGRVVQSNFHDFELVRMHEAPAVEVHIVDSHEEMGGIGEVGVPGIAAATCQALYQASGIRIRTLPVADQLG